MRDVKGDDACEEPEPPHDRLHLGAIIALAASPAERSRSGRVKPVEHGKLGKRRSLRFTGQSAKVPPEIARDGFRWAGQVAGGGHEGADDGLVADLHKRCCRLAGLVAERLRVTRRSPRPTLTARTHSQRL